MPEVKTDIQKVDLLNSFNTFLDSYLATSWVDTVSIRFKGYQDQELPHFRKLPLVVQKLAAGQQIKNADNSELAINGTWEDTLRMPIGWMHDQNTDQITSGIKKLAQQAAKINGQLLTTLINKGEDNIYYNCQSFFASDRSEGNGTNSNKISSVDYPELKIKNPGNPTVAEMLEVIPTAIQHMFRFKNDKGEKLNSDANSFLVMVPFNMMGSTMSSIYGNIDNPLGDSKRGQKFNVTGVANRSLTQPNSFFVFRSDIAKPFFIKEEDPIMVSMDEGHIEDSEIPYRLKRSCTAGYGYWQYACKATFSAK